MADQGESPRVRILVIDDDPDLRAYARSCIETLHGDVAEVIEAVDGLHGLARSRSDGVDLVICDIKMPRMGGFELIRALRADPELKGIPVLLVTGELSGRQARARVESLKGVRVLSKPFNARSLCGTVEDMLRERDGR